MQSQVQSLERALFLVQIQLSESKLYKLFWFLIDVRNTLFIILF
jgi:hypothetical protein